MPRQRRKVEAMAMKGQSPAWLLGKMLPLLLLLVIPGMAKAQYGYTNGFLFLTNGGEITIEGYDGPGGDVTIPDTINGLPVTGIEGQVFGKNTSLTSMMIGSNVTSIPHGAFINCTILARVTIGNSVTSIGDSAFCACSSLTTVTIPASVTSIGYEAFYWCVSLTNVTIGNGVTNLGDSAFYGCRSLRSVTIPNSVTSVGDGVFEYCTRLTTISVDASNLSYSSVDGVLFDRSQTTLIQYPEGKTGGYAVPNGVTNIRAGAFASCTSLTNVMIPQSVTYVGDGAFEYCTSLTGISVAASNLFYSSVDGVLFDKSQTTLIQYPEGKVGGYAVPNSVTSIRDLSFANCSSLTRVTIGNGVTSIGDSAFTDCYCLTGVSIGHGVTNIGSQTFVRCASLSRVTIPNSVISIEGGAFWDCLSLTNVTLGSGVRNIQIATMRFPAEYPFGGCIRLTEIAVDALNPSYSSVDGVLFDKNQTTVIECPEAETGGFTIPESATIIGDFAFLNCKRLTHVTIPRSVTSIGDGAFLGSSLTNVTIPNSVTNIGDFAFDGCTSLTGLTIYSVSGIGADAFSGCSSLRGVYFQGNAPYVSGDVFDGTANATVYYLPGTTGWGPTFGGRPALLWNPQMQGIVLQPKQFRFTITGTTNIPIVVEAGTNLATGNWTPLQTGMLTNGSMPFGDPQWTNYPARFYRIRSP